MEPHNQALDELGSRTSSHDFVRTVVRIQAYCRTVVALWDDIDVLLTPTTPFPAPRHGYYLEAGDPWTDGSRQFEAITFTVLFNITGQPGVSVPTYWTADGVPVGIQLIGRPADEATLLQLSRQLEGERPWAHRRPPITG
jgi:amidase